jgi:alkaline phosphatase D
MRTLLFLAALLLAPPALAQHPHVRAYGAASARATGGGFDPALEPFYHGVASGDPLPDGVVLWTRVTTDAAGPVTVGWRIATDVDLQDVVQSGTVTTGPDRDYTVKVDVSGLDDGATYYYGFTHGGRASLTGRTRTAPAGAVADDDRLRFAVVSCSNWQAGYFTAYAGLARRPDLDAVLHLGDYFYEYPEGGFGDGRSGLEPEIETVTLTDYRVRHAFYKLDPDLRAAHQQHPWITVWDDHESANDAWVGGAENHNELMAVDTTFGEFGEIISIDSTFAQEGPWEERKDSAKRAYFEWMPIREPSVSEDGRIYRRLTFGDRADLVMIDSRLEGREEQLATKVDLASGAPEVDTTAWFDPDRTILGGPQFDWLTEQLGQSEARWKVIGNQVMVVPLAPNPLFPAESPFPEFTNLDAWDGYPAERRALLEFIRDNVEDVVVLTGDIHSSWAANLPVDPYDFTTYNPMTGEGSVAVEFVAPSVTGSTFADGIAALATSLGIPPAVAIQQVEQLIAAAYPQVREFDPASHGYYVLDLSADAAQADWYYGPVDQPGSDETFGQGQVAQAGQSRLAPAETPAATEADAPPLAPSSPPVSAEAGPGGPQAALLLHGAYPNPSTDAVTVGYTLGETARVRIALYDVLGREVLVALDEEQGPDHRAVGFSTAGLAPGAYVLRVEAGGASATRMVTVAE